MIAVICSAFCVCIVVNRRSVAVLDYCNFCVVCIARVDLLYVISTHYTF